MIFDESRKRKAIVRTLYKRGMGITLSYIPDPSKHLTIMVYKQGRRGKGKPIELSTKYYEPWFVRNHSLLTFIKEQQKRYERRYFLAKDNSNENDLGEAPILPCEWYAVTIGEDLFIHRRVWP